MGSVRHLQLSGSGADAAATGAAAFPGERMRILPDGRGCVHPEIRVSLTANPLMDPRELLAANLELIERIVERVCRRSRLLGADADDFASAVKLALIEDDYALLRNAGERSSLAAYLTVVIQRMAVDERIRAFGRWQASAEARRLGQVGVLAETLLSRDRRSLDEALPFVRALDPSMTRERLVEIAERLPVRSGRPRPVDLEAPGTAALRSADAADERAITGDRTRLAGRAGTVMREQLAALPVEDRMMLRLRFGSGMTIAEVSRILRLPQRPLYRRLESLLARLRTALAAAGVDEAAVADLIGSATELQFGLAEAENGEGRAVEQTGDAT